MEEFFNLVVISETTGGWIGIPMGSCDTSRCVFPLTSLQIGDLQSYLSHLSLFLPPESNKFYILVDNWPWLEGLGSRPAHLWQLMVTKSRLSPFANTRVRKGGKDCGETSEKKSGTKGNSIKPEISSRWFSLINAATLSQKKALIPMKKLKYSLQFNHELHRTLFGLIVFEVQLSDIRGINYLNELQTDTSLVIETKYMKRWEFDSILQAVSCMSSWFSGKHHDQNLLREHLLSTIGIFEEEVFYDARDDFSMSSSTQEDGDSCYYDVSIGDESLYGFVSNFGTYPAASDDMTDSLHTPPPPNVPYKRRKVTKASSDGADVDTYCKETPKHVMGSLDSLDPCEIAIEAKEYKDVLILFRFNDRDLPFRLRDIIMADLRLLTLLEAGLPSWVIFLQSYPVFCQLYRPWMCPLARVLYVLVSVITVLIGFYDLYKNVPLLKDTASRLFGPFFDWIENWEMITRIKYLGTMLFLHNFEKAVQWFLMITRTTRSFMSVLAQPMIGPFLEFSSSLLPLWNIFSQVVENFFFAVWVVFGYSWNLIENIGEVIVLPIWFLLSFIWSTAIFLLWPVLWVFKELFCAPFRLILAMSSFVAFICTLVYETLREIWTVISSLLQLASATEATVTTCETSIWRTLWNDLFSQVFRAVRSILNGFVAFFAACNRHRLSIYNHLRELVGTLSRRSSRLRRVESYKRQTCMSDKVAGDSRKVHTE